MIESNRQKNPRTYSIWQSMKGRCLNAANQASDRYMGRGIAICDKWLTFNGFFEDMGTAPEGLTLERIDNNKGYHKENCKWATWSEQALNRRPYKKKSIQIVGVIWDKKRRRFRSMGMINNKRITMYWGHDFFEACCARKSWELTHD